MLPEGVVIVIPTYNECENIEACVAAIARVGTPESLIVVDDRSPDLTRDVVLELHRQFPWVHLAERRSKDGLGPAYLHGFALAVAAPAKVIVQMDADLSHNPRDIIRLIRPILEDRADLTIGSRRVRGGSTHGWSRRRNLLSRFGSLYARTLLWLPARDATSGFRAWRPELLRSLITNPTSANGYGFQIEMLHRAARAKASVREVPIAFRERTIGVSKMTGSIAREAAWVVIRLLASWAKRRIAGN